jgi:hypothetical protein
MELDHESIPMFLPFAKLIGGETLDLFQARCATFFIHNGDHSAPSDLFDQVPPQIPDRPYEAPSQASSSIPLSWMRRKEI